MDLQIRSLEGRLEGVTVSPEDSLMSLYDKTAAILGLKAEDITLKEEDGTVLQNGTQELRETSLAAHQTLLVEPGPRAAARQELRKLGKMKQSDFHAALEQGDATLVELFVTSGWSVIDKKAFWKAQTTRCVNLLIDAGSEAAVGVLPDLVRLASADRICRILSPEVVQSYEGPLGLSLACIAVREDRVDLLEMFLQCGASPDMKSSGSTPLMHAVTARSIPCLQKLLEAGALMDEMQSGMGETAFFLALRKQWLEGVEALAAAGANINSTPSSAAEVRPSVEWCLEKQPKVLPTLLSLPGLNVDGRTSTGETALKFAALRGDEDVVRILLEAGADPNAESSSGDTPTCFAEGRVLEMLLDAGGDAFKGGGNSVVMRAVERADLALLHRLLAPDERSVVRVKAACGATLLHVAACGDSEELLQVLLRAGADVGAVNLAGATPLHLACCCRKPSVVGVLLEAGASVSATDVNGFTPLHKAAGAGCAASVRLLIESGASVHNDTRDSEGCTPLHLAASPDVAKLLLFHGSDVSAQDNHCRTPLHLACRHGRHTVASQLLQAGASVEAVDRFRRTPFAVAVERGHSTCAEVVGVKK